MVRTLVPTIVAAMPDVTHAFADRLAALGFLGLSRWLEWQALYAQTALIEWSRTRREYQHLLPGLTGDHGLPYEPLWNFADIVTMWSMGGVRGQLTAAQGLLTYCALPYLELPKISGRRRGTFDPGRRTTAVVIDFPDRRRPDPEPVS